MRILIGFFFRSIRVVLTPIMLLSEKLTTPQAIQRPPENQKEVDQACRNLALYQFKACPFCIKVRKEMARLNLDIPKRDARNNPEHRHALEQEGGRIKTPCLRIQHEQGQDEWLYESDDIIAWLQQQFEPA